MAYNYKEINYEVMSDTAQHCSTHAELMDAIAHSVANQYMVAEEECLDRMTTDVSSTRYIVSGKRSFEAARDYKDKKVAVLNYANNLSIGAEHPTLRVLRRSRSADAQRCSLAFGR